MLKKISTRDLKTGMFLHELCGSWMDHPFWKTRFLLRDEQDIVRVQKAGITECWIDVSKGADVDQRVPSKSTPEVEAEIQEELSGADQIPSLEVKAVPMAEELTRARKICEQGQEKVRELFGEARLGKAICAEECLPIVDEIASSVYRNPGAIISLARLKDKDEYTYMHSVAVCALMVALGRQLGLDDQACREAGLAGMLHDMGKAFIPLSILNKPGRLTDDEFTIVKSHPEKGWQALKDGPGIGAVTLDVCLHHHEKMDGTGYPHGLKGEEISLVARMGAVCDVYDAITSNRPYKNGWDPAMSIQKMAEWAKGGHFDEHVFQAFVKSLGIYPVGSVVRMASGRLGVVVEQHPASLLTPRVKVFYSTKSQMRIVPETVDLAHPLCQDRIVAKDTAERYGIQHVEQLWATA